MLTINMRSSANVIKSQGVGSCYDEQVGLVKKGLTDFIVSENKSGRYDIVHYHTVNLRYFIERMLNMKNTVGIGYVHFLPETLDESLKLPRPLRSIFYRYLLAFYNSMDCLVTVNPYFVEKIRKQGISRPSVSCIPNFVSTKYFYPMGSEIIADTKKRYGIPGNRFIVLGVGQLQTRKGILDFVETARMLPDVQFVWAGGFSFGRISSGYGEIKKMMKELPSNVTFLGIIPREEMPEIYNMADLMFLPSYDELFPMAILEALCCKKPILLRNVALYEHILFGCYLSGDNLKDFANEITSVANDGAKYAYWADRSWECHKLYSEEAALLQWERLYKTACQTRGCQYDEHTGTN